MITPLFIYYFPPNNKNRRQVVFCFVIRHNERSTPNIPRLFGVPTVSYEDVGHKTFLLSNQLIFNVFQCPHVFIIYPVMYLCREVWKLNNHMVFFFSVIVFTQAPQRWRNFCSDKPKFFLAESKRSFWNSEYSMFAIVVEIINAKLGGSESIKGNEKSMCAAVISSVIVTRVFKTALDVLRNSLGVLLWDSFSFDTWLRICKCKI